MIKHAVAKLRICTGSALDLHWIYAGSALDLRWNGRQNMTPLPAACFKQLIPLALNVVLNVK
jgi:hypothetical protein